MKPRATNCKHLTEGENSLYWRKWGQVRRQLIGFGGFSTGEADAKRHQIHAEALGADKSHKEFTHQELDRVLDAFDTYIIGADPRQARRSVQGEHKRALYAVRRLMDRLGITEPDVTQIVREHFQCPDPHHWPAWSPSELFKLKLHLVSKVRASRRRLIASIA